MGPEAILSPGPALESYFFRLSATSKIDPRHLLGLEALVFRKKLTVKSSLRSILAGRENVLSVSVEVCERAIEIRAIGLSIDLGAVEAVAA
jgi:hypothetical protein